MVGWILVVIDGFHFCWALASVWPIAGAVWVDVAPPSGEREAQPLKRSFQIKKMIPGRRWPVGGLIR